MVAKKFDKTGCPASVPLTELVDNRWQTADQAEVEMLIRIMVLFNSHYWSNYCYAAERHEIPHSDIIMKNKNDLRDSWAVGLADWDGTVMRRLYAADYLQQQRDILDEYLTKYRDVIGQDNTALIEKAEAAISA